MDRHDASSRRFIAFPTVNRHSFPSRGLIHQTDGTGSTNRTVLIVFAATSDVNPKSIKWAYNSSENNKLWFCERVSGGKTCKKKKIRTKRCPRKWRTYQTTLSISHYDWQVIASWTQAPSEQDPMSNRAEQSHTEHAAYIDGQGNSQHQERWSLAITPTTSSTLAWQTIQSKVHPPQQ